MLMAITRRVALTVIAMLSLVQPAISEIPEPGNPVIDGVRHYEAPRYPKCGLDGTVDVQVEIASDGTVLTASAVSDPQIPLLTPWAEEAAYKWIFVPSSSEWSRSKTLTFIFEGTRESESESGVTARYENPLTLHVELAEPTIARLPAQEDGVLGPRCEVHGDELVLEIVPIRYGVQRGVIVGSPEEVAAREYWDALETEFPHGSEYVRFGCIVESEKRAEVMICKTCREARRRWFETRPGYSPPD